MSVPLTTPRRGCSSPRGFGLQRAGRQGRHGSNVRGCRVSLIMYVMLTCLGRSPLEIRKPPPPSPPLPTLSCFPNPLLLSPSARGSFLLVSMLVHRLSPRPHVHARSINPPAARQTNAINAPDLESHRLHRPIPRLEPRVRHVDVNRPVRRMPFELAAGRVEHRDEKRHRIARAEPQVAQRHSHL